MPKRGSFLLKGSVASFVVLATIFLSCSLTTKHRTEESYAVYSAALTPRSEDPEELAWRRKHVMLIFDHTSNGMFRLLLPMHRQAYPFTVKLDMALRNVFHHRLERRFNLPETYRLIPSTQYETLPESETKDGYGIVTLSSVTFTRDGTQAFFYMEHLCGLCGGGRFLVMKKSNGGWEKEGEDWTWIS